MTFWNEKRRRVYPRLILGAIVLWTPLLLGYLWINAASEHERYGGDFIVYWSAAELVQDGRPEDVFNGDEIQRVERTIIPDAPPDQINYPPPLLLVIRPLAVVPFPVALIIWATATLALFVAVLRMAGLLSVGSLGLGLAAMILNFAFGQNGALSAAILTGGLALLDRKPFASGLVLGLLCYKPQLAPIVVVYLLYDRRWSVLAGMAATASVACLVSYAVFGAATWQAFFENIPTAGHTPYVAHLWPKMPTVLSAVQLAGGPKPLAIAAHLVGVAVSVLTAVLLARGQAPAHIRNAGIVVAALVATPYLFVYDLVCLVPVFAWLLKDAQIRPLRVTERLVLGTAAISPLAVWVVASGTVVQLGPLVLLGLLAMTWRRARTPDSIAAQPAIRTGENVGIPYKQGLPVTK